MAPVDRIRFPFRWQFVPLRHVRDGSVHWKWRAYSQSGELVMEGEHAFETLTECIADAKSSGYTQDADK